MYLTVTLVPPTPVSVRRSPSTSMSNTTASSDVGPATLPSVSVASARVKMMSPKLERGSGTPVSPRAVWTIQPAFPRQSGYLVRDIVNLCPVEILLISNRAVEPSVAVTLNLASSPGVKAILTAIGRSGLNLYQPVKNGVRTWAERTNARFHQYNSRHPR